MKRAQHKNLQTPKSSTDSILIDSINKTLVKVEGWIASFSLLLMLVLSVFQILTRNLFDLGFSEIDIINRNLLIICGMMGAVLATNHLRHIKVDALTTFLSEKTLQLLRCPLALFTAAVCAAMCYYSIIFCMDEWQYAPSNDRWTLPFTLTYPIGFSLLSLHFIFLCCNTRK